MKINKKILRNMKEHKSTYILSVLLLILSTYLFTFFNNGTSQIVEGIDNYKEEYKIEDVNFSTYVPIQNLKEVESKLSINVEKMEWADVEVKNGITLRIYKERKEVNLHKIVEGGDLENSKDLIVNEDFFKNANLTIGDKLKVEGGEFTLKGSCASPDYMYFLQNDTSLFSNKETFGVAFVGEEDFQNISNKKYSYSLRFMNSNKEEVKKYLDEKYKLFSWTESENNARITTINGDIKGIFILGKIIPLVVIIIVSVLIGIVVSRLIKSEIKELGTLYALGYEKKVLIKHYMIYPIVIGILGGVLGQIPGVFTCGLITEVLSVEYVLPIIEVRVIPTSILLSLIIPLLIIIPINLIMIYKYLNFKAVDLMKGNIKEGGPKFFDKKLKLKGMSFTKKFKIKELTRNLGRTILTFVSVIFASMLLFFVFAMSDAMNRVIKGYEDSYKFENIYLLKGYSDKDIKGEKFWNIPVEALDKNGEKLNITLDAREVNSELLVLQDMDGEKLSFKDVIIPVSLSEELGVKEGDEITLTNTIDNESVKVTVDKISDSYLGRSLYISLDELYEKTDIPKGSYNGFISKDNVSIDQGEILSTNSKNDILDGVNGMIGPMKMMMYIVGIISGCIGGALLYVIISMIIEENRINISMLKIMGYSNEKINKTILNMNDWLFIIAFVCAVPISNMANNAVFREVTKEMDFTFNADLAPFSIVIVFITMVCIYILSKYASKRKVLRVSMEEVLKSGRE